MKPYAPACDRNRIPILRVLELYIDAGSTVLEIGSGTGQHAVFFGAQLPEVVWQTSDVPECHAGINGWLAEAGLPNVRRPLALDVARFPDLERYDHAFSANTAHILAWPEVEAMVGGVARCLAPQGRFFLYGPFSYGGVQISESNRSFDASLRSGNPAMGVRDLDDMLSLAAACGLALAADHAMPANNRLLVWRRAAACPASRGAGNGP